MTKLFTNDDDLFTPTQYIKAFYLLIIKQICMPNILAYPVKLSQMWMRRSSARPVLFLKVVCSKKVALLLSPYVGKPGQHVSCPQHQCQEYNWINFYHKVAQILGIEAIESHIGHPATQRTTSLPENSMINSPLIQDHHSLILGIRYSR